MTAILRGREFRGALLLVGLMIVFFVLACESPSTTMMDYETSPIGNTLKVPNIASVNSSGFVPTAGGVDAWVSLHLSIGDPEWATDNVSFQTPPSATNVRYKATISSYITPCDPLGFAERYARIDNDLVEYNSTGWKSLPPGYHSFYIYGQVRHSPGISDCISCYPPPGECNTDADVRLNVRWNSVQE